MLASETRIRVRYAETDQMGVVYYANYLVWMEVARVEWCRAAGFEYRDMEREEDAILAVSEATCRYRHPAHFDDEVLVRASILQARSRSIRFAYEMTRPADGKLLATGETLHTVVDHQGRARRLPDRYRPYFHLDK